MNAQSLAMLLSPTLQMSHRLLVALLCHSPNLFADVQLTKYIPPITASSPKLPDTADDIIIELRKQESLLTQIHAEMNAGFVSKKREEQLWEVQRIITQLKRRLRSFEKKHEKSLDETNTTNAHDMVDAARNIVTCTRRQSKLSCSDDESVKTVTMVSTESAATTETKNTPQEVPPDVPSIIPEEHLNEGNKAAATPDDVPLGAVQHIEGLYIDEQTGILMLPKTHPDYNALIRLQLENQELIAWKKQLQARIGVERAEILRLKQLHQQQLLVASNCILPDDSMVCDGDYEKVIENYIRENALLEHKKTILAKEIFEERRELVSLEVELAMQQL